MTTTPEPKTIYAGDTVAWTRSVSDRPAPDWVLTYTLVRLGDAITITAGASGTDHAVNVAPAVTEDWTPGDYLWSAYVTHTATGARYTLGSGSMTIRPNPAAGGFDTRSTARVMLANIDAYLSDPQNLKAASYSFLNRSLSRWSRADLLVERDKLKAEVAAEDAEMRAAAGLGSKRRIRVRFDRA